MNLLAIELGSALGGHEQPPGDVEGDPGATRDGEHRDDDAHHRHIDGEVFGDAGSDARNHPVVGGAPQHARPGLGLVDRGWRWGWCVHEPTVGPPCLRNNREEP